MIELYLYNAGADAVANDANIEIRSLTSLFDLGMESGMQRPQYIIICFENNNVNEQAHDASKFDLMNITEFYCKNGSDFYPEDKMNNNYHSNSYVEDLKRLLISIKIIMDYLIILNCI